MVILMNWITDKPILGNLESYKLFPMNPCNNFAVSRRVQSGHLLEIDLESRTVEMIKR